MMKKAFTSGILAAVMAMTVLACASSQASGPKSQFEGFWTRLDLDENDPMDPEDWQLLNNGSLITIKNGSRNNTWKQENDMVIIGINDGYAIYSFQIINADFLKGMAKNKNNLEWPVELHRIQNPVIIKNKSTGDLAVLGVNGYFILDSATRLYQNLTKDQEYEFMLRYMSDDNGEMNVSSDTSIYPSLLKYYNEDKAEWGFDVAKKKGSIYFVEFRKDDKKYRGVVAFFSFLEEHRYYVVPLD